jgi:predicted transcriptional regulator YdeE
MGENKQETDDNQMTFRVLDLPGFTVVGMECDAVVWDGDGAIGRLWSDFLTRVGEIKQIQKPMIMYGICEYENCDDDHFRYMAAVGVNKASEIPKGMVSRNLKAQRFFQSAVPASISVPDAYSGTIGYAKSLGYETAEYDQIEVYDEIFRDPAYYRFQLLIPIK